MRTGRFQARASPTRLLISEQLSIAPWVQGQEGRASVPCGKALTWFFWKVDAIWLFFFLGLRDGERVRK